MDPDEIAPSALLPHQWKHRAVAFVSGSFRGALSRWTNLEQESDAIFASVTRLSHILAACGEFSLSTDHKNILYMISLTRFNANVALHILHKTQRLDLRLPEFVEYIPGERNTWADFLSRWTALGNAEFPARRVSAVRVPLVTEDLPELPPLEDIAKSPDSVTFRC